MEISVLLRAGVVVLTPSGRMDATNSDEFTNACCAELKKGHKQLVVDLEELEYVSSAGLRAIIIVYKHCHADQASLHFCAPRPMVAAVFRSCGLDAVLKIVPTLKNALNTDGNAD